jgi:hypothetical protein
MNSGKRELSEGANLVIWENPDGYYWLIDQEDSERRENVGPFETAQEAEEDARSWWGLEHAEQDPDLV